MPVKVRRPISRVVPALSLSLVQKTEEASLAPAPIPDEAVATAVLSLPEPPALETPPTPSLPLRPSLRCPERSALADGSKPSTDGDHHEARRAADPNAA